jgi:hypothetical protein
MTRAILLSLALFGLSAAAPAATPVGNGPSIGNPYRILADASGTLVLVDRSARAVITIDPGTGDRTILSDAMHGAGAPLPQDLTNHSPIKAATFDAAGRWGLASAARARSRWRPARGRSSATPGCRGSYPSGPCCLAPTSSAGSSGST